MAHWTVDMVGGSPKWILNSAGKWAVGNSAECCCEDGVECDHCAGSVPSLITATLSGITLCGSILDEDDNRLVGSLPATIPLTVVSENLPETCWWENRSAGTLTFEVYSGHDCPTGSHWDMECDIQALLKRESSTLWSLDIWFMHWSFPNSRIFYDEQVVTEDDCDLGVTFTNDFAAGDCGEGDGISMVVAYGGTVTI